MRHQEGKERRNAVVWAVDPFEDTEGPPVTVVREAAECVRRAGLELLPVHVISVLENNWVSGELPLVLELQAALDRYVSRFSLGEELRSRIIVDETGTRASAVRAVLDVALAEGAEWILVSSHGRSGMERFMLGSFAELLLEQSPVPVVFLPRQNPRKEALASRVALFATDLSRAANAAFGSFLTFASRQRLEIAVFHSLHYPVPSMDFGLGTVSLGPVLPESFIEDQTAWARREGEKLVALAHARGVRARFCLHTGLVPAITGRAVLAAARREKARIIAMPTMSGHVARIVGGSVALEVCRAGRVVTWLYGPKALDATIANAA